MATPGGAGLGVKRVDALTDYAMAGDREKFLVAGMSDYIAKPVEAVDVESALVRVLGNASKPQRDHSVTEE